MNISLKLILYTSKVYSDGSSPIILQYTINRKRIKKVITRCREEDWDPKTSRVKSKVQNSARINHFISTELAKAEKDLYDVKSGDKNSTELFLSSDRLTLQDCFNAELKRFKKEMKFGGYDKIFAIQSQVDGSVDVNHIDKAWFGRMIDKLSDDGNSPRTVKEKVKLVRGVVNKYAKNGISKEIQNIKVATTKTVKQKLTKEEFTKLVELELEPGSRKEVVRDMFVLQVYLRGIRIGDLLQAYSHNFNNGRFRYQDDKTGKIHDVKLIPAAVAIVEKYRGKYERLFPFFSWAPDKNLDKFDNDKVRLKHKESCTSVINYQLKLIAKLADINKPLSSHIARHTYARMAIDKINNPMITMELLGHSDLKVHQGYLNDIRKDDELDKANDDIFG